MEHWALFVFFPHLSGEGCYRFFVSLPASFLLPPPSSSGPQLQALDRSVPRRTRTATPGSKWSPPNLNCKLWIAVFPAGPEQQPLDQSDPHRTTTASSRSQCSPPDPPNSNLWIKVIPAGPQPQRIPKDTPDRMRERMSEYMPESMLERMSEYMPESMSAAR